MLRDTLRCRLADEADVVLVGDVDNELDLLLAVRATQANVVIHVWNEEQMPPIYTHLLQEFPGLQLLGISPNGQDATHIEQRIWRKQLANANVDELLSSLRTESATLADLSLS
ncbi:MAG TPA: hypothetical protein VL096_06390 [Pirellulaceae bacterium]|nr:hypothetical protein [Pirellulaceae bacterium]